MPINNQRSRHFSKFSIDADSGSSVIFCKSLSEALTKHEVRFLRQLIDATLSVLTDICVNLSNLWINYRSIKNAFAESAIGCLLKIGAPGIVSKYKGCKPDR